jgi:hypothetical protein
MTINSNTQFYRDLTDESKTLNVNNGTIPLGYWNLILSIREVSMYAIGMKPHRNWRITNVKQYFGVKGDAKQIKTQLEEIRDMLKG